MNEQPVLLAVDDRGVATVTLNRPHVHNAFNDKLIAELARIFAGLADDPRVRVVVMRAEGKSFSAGADAKWMRAAAHYSDAQNTVDAVAMANMLRGLNFLPKPTLALVQGAALGGGVGLVACADIVIAAATAKFGLTEVRLGLTPATISPYVVAAMGQRQARRYFLSGERFDAETAMRLGLAHMVVADRAALEAAGDEMIEALLAGAPGAITDAKKLIFDVTGRAVDDALVLDTAGRIARRRAGREGREGLAAFLDKRRPVWAADRSGE